MCDVLPHLTSLSHLFQKDVDLSVIQPQVSATISVLKNFRTQPGPHLRQLNDTVATVSSNFNLSVSEEKKKAFQENVCEHNLDKLVQNLEDRFCDGVIRALATIFSAEKAVRVDSANFSSYGENELDVLSSQFTSTVEKKRLCQEWACFKHICW